MAQGDCAVASRVTALLPDVGQSGESSGDDSDREPRAGGDNGDAAADAALPASGREDWMTKPTARSLAAPPDKADDDEAAQPKTTVSGSAVGGGASSASMGSARLGLAALRHASRHLSICWAAFTGDNRNDRLHD